VTLPPVLVLPRMSRLLRILPLLAALAGCAGASAHLSGEVSYVGDAEGNFKLGEEEMKGSNYLEATQYYQYVRNKFPYSRFAALSQLRMADASFLQGKYLEAIDEYRGFVRDRPTNQDVDYAAFHIGLANYKDIPTDFFILPPSFERDQQPVKNAQSALKDFLLSYPNSKYVPEAKTMLADVRLRLAKHEIYVGNFYKTHGALKAAAWRYQAAAKLYADTPLAESAHRDAEAIYKQLGDSARPENAGVEAPETAPPPTPGLAPLEIPASAPNPAP
jgi:outer membrane protein assembly factor BamD